MEPLKALQSEIIAAYHDCPGFDPQNSGNIDFLTKIIETLRPLTPIQDPSGYVYEAVPSNRLEGVTAIISCEAGNGSAWDAAAYDQVNPQITGTDGGYYWDVPQGKWKVSFTKDGYEATSTEEVAKAAGYSDGWLPVPPPQLEINVGMISTAVPAVKQTVAYTNRVEVEFSQYMDIDSVVSALSLIQNDVSVSSCRIVPLNAEYNLENIVQYATRFAIVSDNSDLSDGLIVSVAGTAKNYAGTPMGEGYTSPLMTLSVRPTGITAPDKVSVILHEATDINVILQPGIENRELTVESLSPAIVTVGSDEAVTGKTGNAEISLTGILPGSGLIRICEPKSGLSKTISVQVGAVKDIPSDITVQPVTAVLENGTIVTSGMTVPAGAKISLQTQTADAVIRYTLDDTCPCTDAALTYSMPITINDSTVLRAAAYKDGTYSTTIRLELHVETSSGDTPSLPEHTHNWAAAWASDMTHHWHECIVDGCTITNNSDKKDYSEHSYDSDTDTDCNICGFVRTVVTPSHTHSWDSAWHNDGMHHWHECTVSGCDITEDSGKNGYGTHIYDNDADIGCNSCGYIRMVPTPSHTHSWDSAWHNDGTYHWHGCTVSGCDITADSSKNSYGAHVYDNDTDTDCNICGFVRTVVTPSHTHSWNWAWNNNSTHHWHECVASGCDITVDSGKNSYGAHVYDSDADIDCNTCGFIRTVAVPFGQTYTITFNANGGTVDTYDIATGIDGKLSGLPAAVREGYTFKGWFTAEDGGVLITIDMEFTQNTTVYAHWQQNSSDGHTDSLTGDEAASTDSASPAEKRSYVDILLYGIGIMVIAAALVYYKKKKR